MFCIHDWGETRSSQQELEGTPQQPRGIARSKMPQLLDSAGRWKLSPSLPFPKRHRCHPASYSIGQWFSTFSCFMNPVILWSTLQNTIQFRPTSSSTVRFKSESKYKVYTGKNLQMLNVKYYFYRFNNCIINTKYIYSSCVCVQAAVAQSVS
jgi:hypothetical protein